MMVSHPPIQVGTALPSVLGPSGQAKLARFLEALGYQQIWLPDHLLFPEGTPAFDCWTTMAAVATATKSVQFGPAVTDPHRTHPAVLAQRIATLDQLSQGRFLLGLGSGESMNLDPFGISWQDRKVGRMKEFISVLRGLLDNDEAFTFQGDFYQLRQAKLSVRPYKKRRVPIFMAALGPMMQKLAGRMVDGWFPTLIPHSEYAGYHRPMAEAATAAGRDSSDIARVATVAVSINTDGKTTVDEIIDFLRPLSGLLVWPPVMERLGHDFNPPKDAHMSYMDVNPCELESLRAYSRMMQWMPMELMREAITYGDCHAIYSECCKYIEQGATHLQIQFASPDPLGSFVLFAYHVLPKLTGRPPTFAAKILATLGSPLIRRGYSKKHFPAPRTPSPEFWALDS